MISTGRSFLFVHVTKTAGNSIQAALLPYSECFLTTDCPDHDGIENFGVRTPGYPKLGKHSTLRDYKRELGPKLFHGLFKFSCVRNPWERLVSFHFSPHWGPVEWDREAFKYRIDRVDDGLANLCYSEAWFGMPGGAASPFDNLDYIVRFERLDEDFKLVCKYLDIPYSPLPVLNRSRHAHYSTYYDAELVELVRLQYSDVIERFGYEFEFSDA